MRFVKDNVLEGVVTLVLKPRMCIGEEKKVPLGVRHSLQRIGKQKCLRGHACVCMCVHVHVCMCVYRMGV